MCCCVMAARKAGQVHRNALVTQRHKFVCGGSAFRVKDTCAVFSTLQEGGSWTFGCAASWVPPAVTLQL